MLDKYISLQKKLRLQLLELYYSVNAGHIGCSLSCIDLLISILLFKKKEQDTFILSKGHAAAALYTCLHHLGKISDTDIKTFYQDGTKLPAHPSANHFNDIPFALGSLGHGFPIGVGIAKADKLLRKNNFTYVLMSDGETNEGTTWEAAHFAVQHKLDNLIIIIDKNRIQGFGSLIDILGDTADEQKWKTMNFDVVSIDGHSIPEIIQSIEKLQTMDNGRPKVIIANTIKGKGVSYMENTMEWHYLPISLELYQRAISDIKKWGLTR